MEKKTQADPAVEWGKKAEARQDAQRQAAIHWLDSPLVQRHYLNARISGNEAVNWFEWAAREYLSGGVDKACNLGCGDGGLERHAGSLGLARSFDSYDISPKAIELARKLASEAGLENINYDVADFNAIELPREGYGAVFASMSLHHVDRLERLFEEITDSLAPGGWLVFNEFVGPDRFQWTAEQLSWTNRVLAILPERLRLDREHDMRPKERMERPSVEEMLRIDPSEAIRSSEILSLARKYLHEVKVVSYGGSILHLLLGGIVGNFNLQTPEDEALLKLCCLLEEALTNGGVVAHDFAIGVFRKDGELSSAFQGGKNPT